MHNNFTYDLNNANTDILRLEICKQLSTTEVMGYCIADVQEMMTQTNKENSSINAMVIIIFIIVTIYSIYKILSSLKRL